MKTDWLKEHEEWVDLDDLMNEFENASEPEKSTPTPENQDILIEVLQDRQAHLEKQINERLPDIVTAAQQAGIDPGALQAYMRRVELGCFDEGDLYDYALHVLEQVAMLAPDKNCVGLWLSWIIESRRWWSLLVRPIADETTVNLMRTEERIRDALRKNPNLKTKKGTVVFRAAKVRNAFGCAVLRKLKMEGVYVGQTEVDPDA